MIYDYWNANKLRRECCYQTTGAVLSYSLTPLICLCRSKNFSLYDMRLILYFKVDEAPSRKMSTDIIKLEYRYENQANIVFYCFGWIQRSSASAEVFTLIEKRLLHIYMYEVQLYDVLR